jgi:hypothetical protein
MNAPDPAGKSVLILAGEFAGEEGICLGPVHATTGLWAVSPDSSERVVNLRYAEEFGVLVNRGQEPGRN